MDLSDYRASAAEQKRTEDLLTLFPASGGKALDLGARDGHFSRLLAERFERVVALDLIKPDIEHPRVECVKGNAASLQFEDNAFDFVFCAEVLEHIPTEILVRVCNEIERVSKRLILIGVPYRQDIRVGRTVCSACGGKNPPWGHVNAFDEARIKTLFNNCKFDRLSFVGSTSEQTNEIAVRLMDLAGNPYGTYQQEERCIHCDAALVAPPERNVVQKIATRLALWAQSASGVLAQPRANWIHVVLSKNVDG